MGSRIMHSIIAYKIAENLSLEDRTPFLLGGIAPDAVSPKDESHFYKGDHADFSRNIDYKGFLQKYNSLKNNYYILGYYTHLIADDIWLKGFYMPWLKNRMEVNKEILHMYHHDFSLLNGKLLDYYGVTSQLREVLSDFPPLPDLEEVKANDVEGFIPYVLGDLDFDQKDLNEKLNVFTFDQIVGYIETSIDIGLNNIKSIISV